MMLEKQMIENWTCEFVQQEAIERISREDENSFLFVNDGEKNNNMNYFVEQFLAENEWLLSSPIGNEEQEWLSNALGELINV